MVIFGVPAVVTFCSGALILGWAGILWRVWAFLERQSESWLCGWAIILGEHSNFAHQLLQPFSFLASKYSLGTDVLNSAPCVPCTVSFETHPDSQTVTVFGLRGQCSPQKDSDFLEPSQTTSNLETSTFSFTEKL